MTTGEWEDSKKVADVYFRRNYMQVTLQSRYFIQPYSPDESLKDYFDIIDDLMQKLRGVGVEKWGESRGERLQFAVLNVSYELDLFCKKNNKNLGISSQSLVDVSKFMECFEGDFLQSSIMILKAQIFTDLLDDAATGYEYLLKVCDFCGSYNAYAYFLKGNYWLTVGLDYEKAVRHYQDAIGRYPEYYQAWYRLGFSYYKMGDKSKALISFETVTKILKPRFLNNNVSPLESEYLFLHISTVVMYTMKSLEILSRQLIIIIVSWKYMTKLVRVSSLT